VFCLCCRCNVVLQGDGRDLIIVDTSGRHKQEAALFEEMRQVMRCLGGGGISEGGWSKAGGGERMRQVMRARARLHYSGRPWAVGGGGL
jgi:hypothetical protein